MQEYNHRDFPVWRAHDVLLQCQTYERAERWVDDMLSKLSPREYESVVRSFLQLRVCDVQKRVRGISGLNGGALIDDGDIRIYRLLELVDTCHDFFNARTTSVQRFEEFIEEYGYQRYIPSGLTSEMIRNEKLFVNWLSAQKTLIFGADIVQNPLYAEHDNLLSSFNIRPSHTTLEKYYTGQLKSVAQKRRRRIVPIEIYTEVDDFHRLEVLKFQQVVQLCGQIMARFGETIEFNVDSVDSNHLLMLVVAVQHLSRKFWQTFKVDLATQADVSTKLICAVQRIHRMEPKWKTTLTDSNIFDAAQHSVSLPVDPRPTGTILRAECGFQIALKGIQVGQNQNQLKTRIVITDEGKSFTMSISDREAVAFSTNNIVVSVAARITAGPPAQINTITDRVQSCSCILQFALKRSGDWSQVENAAKWGKVFVTGDKFAALYALYRRVPFIFMRRMQHSNNLDNLNTEQLPDFLRYVFILG